MNREAGQQPNREGYQAHRDATAQQRRRRYELNRRDVLEASRLYRQAHPEKMREQVRRRQERHR